MLTVDFEMLDLPRGARLLDAGCGTGRHICHAYQHYDVDVVGVDTNEADLACARFTLEELSRGKNNTWVLENADVTKLPFPAESFETVICSEVLEHIPDGLGALRELFRVLKRGGRMALSAPNFLPERICWLLSSEYHSNAGGHIKIYKKAELRRLLREVGFIYECSRYKHGLHSPYWWLKCLVGPRREDRAVNLYKRFLEWDIIAKPKFTRMLEMFLNLFIPKSIVLYARKPR